MPARPMIRVRFLAARTDAPPPPTAPAAEIAIDDAGGVIYRPIARAESRGRLDAAVFRRLRHAASDWDPERLGRVLGAGTSWVTLRVDRGEIAVRYRGPAGVVEPASWDGMPAAIAPLLSVVARAAIGTARDALGTLVDGLPDVFDEERVVLRARRSAWSGGDASTVVLYDDGRVERWALEGARGRRLAIGAIPAREVPALQALALAVVRMPKPVVHAHHDPTSTLALVVIDRGAAHGWTFAWGRASRNDTPLEPVVGDANLQTFGALLAALERLASGLVSPVASAVPSPASSSLPPPTASSAVARRAAAPAPGSSFLCERCKTFGLVIEAKLALPPDDHSDEVAVQLLRCVRCDAVAMAVYSASRRGHGESCHHVAYWLDRAAYESLARSITACAAPADPGCPCATHRAQAAGAYRIHGARAGFSLRTT